jgi:hypothetical protein
MVTEQIPHLLVHAWGWQYWIGYCHLRQAIRSFRVDRILDLVVLDQTVEEPTDFDLQAYLATEPFFQPKVRGSALGRRRPCLLWTTGRIGRASRSRRMALSLSALPRLTWNGPPVLS